MGRGPSLAPAVIERALNLWASSLYRSGTDIAAALGITTGALNSLVSRARAAGDLRAIPRVVGPRPGSRNKPKAAPIKWNGPNTSRGIYRTPEVSRALKDDVLNSWSEGLDGLQVALRHRTSERYVHAIVRRARETNDPRAVARRRANRFLGCDVTLKDAVLSLTAAGIGRDDTAIIVGVTRERVQQIQSRARACVGGCTPRLSPDRTLPPAP